MKDFAGLSVAFVALGLSASPAMARKAHDISGYVAVSCMGSPNLKIQFACYSVQHSLQTAPGTVAGAVANSMDEEVSQQISKIQDKNTACQASADLNDMLESVREKGQSSPHVLEKEKPRLWLEKIIQNALQKEWQCNQAIIASVKKTNPESLNTGTHNQDYDTYKLTFTP